MPMEEGLAIERAAFSEALSAPGTATLSAADFRGADYCGGCHTTHISQWRSSPHAHAMRDQVFQGLVELQRAQPSDLALDTFCVQCHSPIASRTGQLRTGFDFSEAEGLSTAGVTCEACHRAQHIERPYNAGLSISGDETLRGPIADPEAPHASEYSEIFEDAKLCATCHDVRNPNGLKLESPYEEWLQSPAAAESQTCQTCHMQKYIGRAAPALHSPERELHSHRFRALTVNMDEEGDQDAQAKDAGSNCSDPGLLCSAAALQAELRVAKAADDHAHMEQREQRKDEGRFALEVSLRSLVDGHRFPTGSIFFRQLWLAVSVRDDQGVLVFESGLLDPHGDLYDIFQPEASTMDPQLKVFGGYLIDVDGEPTRLPWRAVRLDSNALEPRETRELSYQFTSSNRGRLHAQVVLRFREFAPSLMHEIDRAELIGQLEVSDVARTEAVWAPERMPELSR
jgi:hypothetical protein